MVLFFVFHGIVGIGALTIRLTAIDAKKESGAATLLYFHFLGFGERISMCPYI